MIYLRLFESKDAASGKTVELPSVCTIEGVERKAAFGSTNKITTSNGRIA